MRSTYKKVRAGFEPAHQRFAVTCLTTWLPNHYTEAAGVEPAQPFGCLRFSKPSPYRSGMPPKNLDSSTGASVS